MGLEVALEGWVVPVETAATVALSVDEVEAAMEMPHGKHKSDGRSTLLARTNAGR